MRSSSLIKSLYIFSFWFFLDLFLISGLTIKSLYFAFIFSFFTSSIILFFVSSSSLKASYEYIFRINLNLDAFKKQNTNLQFKKFQRRLSISWLSGYISFQLVVPIAYILINPSSAAVLGSLLQYTSGISSLSLSPLMANAPKMGQLQSKKLFQQTKSLYFRRLTIALFIYFASIFIFIFVVKNNFFFTSFKYGVDFSWVEFYLLISFITTNFLSSCFAILLRSSAEEPLLIASILQAIVTIILLPFFAKYFKFVGINSSLLISALPSFFLISKLFLIKIRSLEKFKFMSPILTIIIPTYNRLSQWQSLSKNIKEITDTFEDKINILISDNFSDDGTINFLNEQFIKKSYPKIGIIQQPENIGATANIVELTKLVKQNGY